MRLFILLIIGLFTACQDKPPTRPLELNPDPFLIILGTLQDGGAPHVGCNKSCCIDFWAHPDPTRKVVSIGLIDPENQQSYIFEATPDFPEQIKLLKSEAPFQKSEIPNGIFLTHAHIGHYTGLMYLGKEAINTSQIPLFVMTEMQKFLTGHGPWSQLVALENIVLKPLDHAVPIQLTSTITITPILVPHRDEFSETVGYRIKGPNKSALFIPDIDKWQKWPLDIIEQIQKVDYAFIDGTFFDAAEINHRSISEIPHPFIVESMSLFGHLTEKERNKIYFIHLNHTNPALDPDSRATEMIQNLGYHIAAFKQKHYL